MAEILLAKQQSLPLTEQERLPVKRVLFEHLQGVRETDRRAWARLWRRIVEAEPGEVFRFEFWFDRSGPYHRRHFAMVSRLYEAQESFGDFEIFRQWLKIGAGFVDWVPGPRGAVVPIPKSIAYKNLDDEGMRAFHEAVVAFLRTAGAQKALWPRVNPQLRAEAAEAVLQEFGE